MIDWKEELVYQISMDLIHTDSDIEDFADANNISTAECFKYLAELNTKGTECEGCKYIQFYPDMSPCTNCSRRKLDLYCKND